MLSYSFIFLSFLSFPLFGLSAHVIMARAHLAAWLSSSGLFFRVVIVWDDFFNGLSSLNLSSAFSASELPFKTFLLLLSLHAQDQKAKVELGCASQLAQI